jgi:hypothetical protein
MSSAQCNIFQALFVLYSGVCDKEFLARCKKKIYIYIYFKLSDSIQYLPVGEEHLSKRHESSSAEISRMF